MRKCDPEHVDVSSRLRFRAAAPGDAAQVAHLWKELSVDQLGKDRHYHDDPDSSIEPDRAYFERVLTMPECQIFVAEEGDRLIAFIEVWLNGRDSTFFLDDYAYVLHFFVEPDERAMEIYDICNSLYVRAEAWAVERGCSTLQADVFYHNEKVARILALRCGFEPYRTRYVKTLTEGAS